MPIDLSWLWTLLCLLVATVILTYLYLSKDYRKWLGSSVPIAELPTFPYGNMKNYYDGTETIMQIHRRLYKKIKPRG